MGFIQAYPHFFRRPLVWFETEWHVIVAFERLALQRIAEGREHYSAAALVSEMSLESRVRERAGQYKIGNDNCPDLARVFVVLHPEHLDFWEMRRKDTAEFKAAVRAWVAGLTLPPEQPSLFQGAAPSPSSWRDPT